MALDSANAHFSHRTKTRAPECQCRTQILSPDLSYHAAHRCVLKDVLNAAFYCQQAVSLSPLSTVYGHTNGRRTRSNIKANVADFKSTIIDKNQKMGAWIVDLAGKPFLVYFIWYCFAVE